MNALPSLRARTAERVQTPMEATTVVVLGQGMKVITVQQVNIYCRITKPRLLKFTQNFQTKKWKFLGKNSDIFHISAQNIDCGNLLELPRRGGYNEYPQFMFLSSNKKNNVYLCKPHFYYIKMGFKGVKIL